MVESDIQLTPERVRHIAHLSRLALTDTEVEQYYRQLEAIVGYMQSMREIDCAGVPRMIHPAPEVNHVRQDVAAQSLTPDEALAMAPAHRDNKFCVPQIQGDHS